MVEVVGLGCMKKIFRRTRTVLRERALWYFPKSWIPSYTPSRNRKRKGDELSAKQPQKLRPCSDNDGDSDYSGNSSPKSTLRVTVDNDSDLSDSDLSEVD